MAFVQAGGTAVHYLEQGPPRASDPRTLIALHGFTADHRMMVAALEPVLHSRTGWRRLYLDLPGMGRTPAPDALAGTDDVLTIVAAAIDALVDGPYAVAGLSYGAHLALGLAGRPDACVTGLALLTPMVVATHAARDVPGLEVLHEEPGLRYADEEALAEVGVVRTTETLRRTREEIDTAVAVADRAALDRIEASYGGSFASPERFGGPALVITGRQDNIVGFGDQLRRAAGWPRCTFAILDRAGHNLYLEQPVLFEALVAEWLDRVEESTPID